jgi:chromosomal replication initiation ATPase DnaA
VPFAPLVVAGPPGSGRTALLEAIAARVRELHPGAAVELLSVDALAERCRSAMLVARTESCRAELTAADLVLLDDFERLARHPDCQGFVADLLDARRAAGRETVVTLAVPLEQLGGLDARLLRRLQDGAAVPLALPGAEARLGILRRRLAETPEALPEPVVRAVAEAGFPSMRDYTGALARLVAFQQASPVPLSPADALLLIGAPGAPRLPEAPPERHDADEFGSFLSEVTASLSEQVDRWRRRIGAAVLRWSGEGFRTRRLEALLGEDTLGDPEPVLAAFESDALELGALAREAAELAPDLAGAQVFRDPDQLAAARALVAQARQKRAPLSAPLAHFRWEDFAEGPATRLPMLAVRDIIAEPGRRYSPLIVVGQAGTGKTHLLHGLGNALIERGIAPAACLGTHAFVAEVSALADPEALAAWRLRYRWVGALLLDDLHLLAGAPGAQAELELLVGELLEGGRQMVFTSAVPLESLSGIEPRLLDRLRGGLSVELPPPDREVRLAVIKRMLAGTGAAHDAALADYLAGRSADSVRAVQGMVQRVLGEAAAQRVQPSPALAREVLEVIDLGPARAARKSVASRASGILSPGLGLVKSPEKMIERWPGTAERLIGELR